MTEDKIESTLVGFKDLSCSLPNEKGMSLLAGRMALRCSCYD